jgi:Sec-independent protein translocase protein TatA
MSDKINNPPVETHRDGAVSAKVWRNFTKDGKPIYSVTIQRTYTNPKTQQIAESHSFGGTDILKIPHLASEAYRTIGKMRELDRAEQPTQDPQLGVQQAQAPQQGVAQQPVQQQTAPSQQGLAQQRDEAMSGAAPTQNQVPTNTPTYER